MDVALAFRRVSVAAQGLAFIGKPSHRGSPCAIDGKTLLAIDDDCRDALELCELERLHHLWYVQFDADKLAWLCDGVPWPARMDHADIRIRALSRERQHR